MGEALLRQELPDLNVGSAGLGALVGHPADATSTELMREIGLDLSQHRAQQFTSAHASQADLILVMEGEQKFEIQRRYPPASGKVFRLGELGNFDIPDPYKKSRQAFDLAFGLIADSVKAWVPRIRALS